jgi:glutaminase
MWGFRRRVAWEAEFVAIAPGKGAIAVFAPPLDEAGNSVKAQKVIEYVARKLNYNLFSPSSVALK